MTEHNGSASGTETKVSEHRRRPLGADERREVSIAGAPGRRGAERPHSESRVQRSELGVEQ